MTYMFILKCALKLVEEIILCYDARSKKHQIVYFYPASCGCGSSVKGKQGSTVTARRQ